MSEKVFKAILSKELSQKLMSMGLSPTKVCKHILNWYISDYDSDIGMLLNIEVLKNKIATYKSEITILENKKEALAEMEQKLLLLEEEKRNADGTIELTKMMQYVARRIIAYHYDYKTINEKCKNTIADIKKLDPKYDLLNHIRRVKAAKERNDMIDLSLEKGLNGK